MNRQNRRCRGAKARKPFAHPDVPGLPPERARDAPELQRPRSVGAPAGFCCAVQLVALAFVACTTLHPVDMSELPDLTTQVEQGARYVVVTTDGAREEIRVTAVGRNHIVGIASDGRELRIQSDEIRELDRVAVAPGKTAALIGGLAAAYVAVVVGVALHAILSGF